MKIKLPENYQLPEDVADGGTFEELVTFTLDGTNAIPTMIGGIELEDAEAEMDEETEAPVEDAMAGPVDIGAQIMGGM
jgi:hypothetical protein